MRVKGGHVAVAWEDARTGQALEGHRGEGAAIGGGRRRVALTTWRKVGDRSHEASGDGHGARGPGSGQAEVAEVDVVDEHFGGLDVAVHEPGGMRRAQPVNDLTRQRDGAPGAERAAARERRQCEPSHELHAIHSPFAESPASQTGTSLGCSHASAAEDAFDSTVRCACSRLERHHVPHRVDHEPQGGEQLRAVAAD